MCPPFARSSIGALALAAVLCALAANPAHLDAATFSVDTTADAVDALPGDGVCLSLALTCSLRAAIQEANALAGADVVVVPAGTYVLTLVGAGETSGATGDLNVSDDLDLQGALFLEGGPEASLVVRGSKSELARVGSYETGFLENNENQSFWWLPNVLALEAR